MAEPAQHTNPQEPNDQAEETKQTSDEALATAAEQFADDDAAIEYGEDQSARIAELEGEVAQLKDQLMRAVAESENIRKRAQRDVEESNKYAVSGFARELINVLENLHRASDSIPVEARDENANLKVLGEGVDMTLRELLNVFERFGIVRIDPLGEKFDHNVHQAVAQIEDPEAENGTILQVLQAGYILHDRLLRPAMVGVAKKPGDNTPNVDTKA